MARVASVYVFREPDDEIRADDVSTRGMRRIEGRGRGRRGDKLYRFSFLSVGNFEIARRRALARLRTADERPGEGCTG